MTALAEPATMTYQREPVSHVWDEIQPLLAKHWEEVAQFQDIPLSPSRQYYDGMDLAGLLRIFTVRDGDHRLIGYNVYSVSPSAHYRTSKLANQDVIFMDKDARGGGLRFLSWCEDYLRAEGVQVVYNHVSARNDFGAALERRGYVLAEKIYSKRLDLEVAGG